MNLASAALVYLALGSWVEPRSDRTVSGPGVSVEQMLDALHHPEARVRVAAANALAGQEEHTRLVLPELLDCLRDPERDVRAAALEALDDLQVEPRKLAFALADALLDEDPLVREDAVVALEPLVSDVPAVLPAVLDALEDRSEAVREVALHTLRAVGPSARAAVPDFIAALSHPAPLIREASAFALGLVGPDAMEAFPSLLDLLFEDDTIEVRQAAADALGEILPDGEAQLEALLDPPPEPYQQTFLYGVFTEIGSGAIPALKQSLKAKNPMVRGAAQQALDKLQRPTVRDERSERTRGTRVDPQPGDSSATPRIPADSRKPKSPDYRVKPRSERGSSSSAQNPKD